MGEGRMPSKVILTWEDQMFTVNAFSFGSGDEGLPIPGQWEIDHEAGKLSSVGSKASLGAQMWQGHGQAVP